MRRQLVLTEAMMALSACTAGAQDEGMVLIEGGTFQMGSPATELERDADETLHEMTGYDIFRIERATPYSATYNSLGLYAEALTEYRNQAVPELKAYVTNLADYDVILLGYCNWWASIPAPVRSFLMHDDFSGKTIVPFCSMGGGRFGQTISAIAKLAPESVILKGIDVTYSSYDRTAIRSWLDGITKYQQTSDIRTVKPENASNNAFYSLNSQKVTEPRKGIYIVNGEKRIIE